jgi:hypothetical protein
MLMYMDMISIIIGNAINLQASVMGGPTVNILLQMTGMFKTLICPNQVCVTITDRYYANNKIFGFSDYYNNPSA